MRDAGPVDPWPDCSFYYGHSAAPLYANGLLYAGALDGKLRILDAATGKVLRVIDTKRRYDADNGVEGHGGDVLDSCVHLRTAEAVFRHGVLHTPAPDQIVVTHRMSPLMHRVKMTAPMSTGAS